MTPWTVAHQLPLSTGFFRQECGSGLPFPSSGNLPDPGMELSSLATVGGFFMLSCWGSQEGCSVNNKLGW